MQGYSYSIFSSLAIVIHLIVNFDLLVGRRVSTARGRRYRGFLLGLLAYYLTDAAWGVFAGLRWTRVLYADTVLFFLSLVAFVVMWSRFVVSYLGLRKRTGRFFAWFGHAVLAFNVVGLVVNPFNDCFFYLDSEGVYRTGFVRDLAFCLLVAFYVLLAVVACAKVLGERDSGRRRGLMVFLSGIVMAVSIVLQVVWPLTPFTALGCLVGTCFLNVFVVQDEQAEKHMAQLESALERARAAEKTRSMFFSIVSHDIRTPLNAILGYAELLQFGGQNEAERNEALESIRASGTTLLQLVNDVLDLAKMDAGKMTLRPEPMRLSHLTNEVFASFRMSAAGKGVELVDRTADVPAILLDEHRFRQLLFNLVGNAVKFTERGSVTVAASYAGTDLEVSVSDTGRGIPSDMLAHVLDPFVQVQDPTHGADRAAGTGLGLPICRRMAEAMGGRLVVESELGKGSTFRVRIPNVAAAGKDAAPAAETAPAAVPDNPPERVLVVDDSPVNRAVLTALLKRAGVPSIDQAGDGREALSALDAAAEAGRPFDFVFSDFWMPNVNGLEFVEKLRADARFGRLPVFAVTADTEFNRDARTRLFTGVLLKPLTYGKLVDVLSAKRA